VIRTLSAIGQIEIAVKTFWAKLGENLPHPSLQDLGYVMANTEVIHNNAYERLISILGLETDSLQLTMLQQSSTDSWKDVQEEIRYYLAAFEGRAELGDNCDFVGRYKRFEFDYALDTPCEEDPFIKERNQKWMQVLPSLLRSKRCFVAVGLLHLMHNCGLIVDLRKAGFVVEPVPL
jgi:hypothetical protein